MKKFQPTYEIRLQGHLDPNRFQLFEDLKVSHLSTGETVLLLTGLDQAKLFGMLLQIRDMGVPLLSLKRMNPKNDDPSPIGEERKNT